MASTWEPGGHMSMWRVSVLGQSARQVRDNSVFRGVSPDGAHVAFSPEPGPSGEIHEVWIMGSQGDNPQKVLSLAEHEWFGNIRWSPNGQRLAYIKRQHTPGSDRSISYHSIETCDLNGASRTVVVPTSKLFFDDFCWLRDGRIIYSRQEAPDSNDDNLWQIGVDSETGRPAGKPKRITQWAGSFLWGMSASADGKRLTLYKETYQAQAYLVLRA